MRKRCNQDGCRKQASTELALEINSGDTAQLLSTTAPGFPIKQSSMGRRGAADHERGPVLYLLATQAHTKPHCAKNNSGYTARSPTTIGIRLHKQSGVGRRSGTANQTGPCTTVNANGGRCDLHRSTNDCGDPAKSPRTSDKNQSTQVTICVQCVTVSVAASSAPTRRAPRVPTRRAPTRRVLASA